MAAKYTINELAKEYGLPVTTLRFYQRINLFTPEFRDENNNYGYYSADQIPLLEMITFMRSLGVPVKDVQDIITESICREDVLSKLAAHRMKLQRQIVEMEYCAEKNAYAYRLIIS